MATEINAFADFIYLCNSNQLLVVYPEVTAVVNDIAVIQSISNIHNFQLGF